MEERKISGKKRKRVDDQNDISVKLQGKLHHGVKEVRKASKKAKTFETQKLVKRLKALRGKDADEDETKEIEAQLEFIKKADHEAYGNTALRSKILKDRLLSNDESIKDAVAQELSSNLITSAKPSSKVQARLLSSKTISAEVTLVLEALRRILDPKPNDGKGLEAPQAEATNPTKKSRKMETSLKPTSEDESDGTSEDGDSDQVELSAQELVGDAGWESGSVHSEGEAGVEGLESSNDSSSESSEEEDADHQRPRKGHVRSDAKPASKAQAALKPAASASSSTFLPSLSVGFVRGDSDGSDWSGDEGDDADVAPKKNRRGQRARRAIWEKKYGRNANHVQKHQNENHTGLRKTDGQRSRENQRQIPRPGLVTPSASTPQPSIRKPEPEREVKSLHPSWEAKRRMKEKQNPTIVPPQGKKIVF